MEYHTMRYINTIARCANLHQDEALQSAGLSSYQSAYIPIICRKPGITQDQIARELHVNRSSVTRQMTALEDAGFITRQRCTGDRRAIQVYPTDKALEVLPLVRKARQTWRALLLEGMTDTEREALDKLLARLADRAEDIV